MNKGLQFRVITQDGPRHIYFDDRRTSLNIDGRDIDLGGRRDIFWFVQQLATLRQYQSAHLADKKGMSPWQDMENTLETFAGDWPILRRISSKYQRIEHIAHVAGQANAYMGGTGWKIASLLPLPVYSTAGHRIDGPTVPSLNLNFKLLAPGETLTI